MTEAVVIWHNPACGTSRNALAMIRAAGIEPTVVEYLKTPPTRDELERGINAAGLSVRAAIRQKDTPYGELGLGDASLTEGKLLDAMLAHPILINRPFVFTSRGVRLCRPSEAVLEILPAPLPDDFVKEDGEVVRPLLTKVDDCLPSLDEASFRPVDLSKLHAPLSTHPPRVLLLYGSLRPVSYSRLLTLEAERLLKRLGCETRVYDPAGLPLPDDGPADHPKVKELRELSLWSEAQVWTSPERHGAMTGVMKSQIDWIPLAVGSVRPTQGRTLAVMQVSGGSQSFNAVNQMRVLGRWMRMLTIPNQSSVAKAFQEFDGSGRMKPSSYYDRVVDVMEELTKFTWATRDLSSYLTDRYSERKESAEALEARVALSRAAS